VLFSDIPNNRIMCFLEDDGHCSVYRQPSMNLNGNAIDREGRLITCEHSGRRITRTELDGSITIIADSYNGKKLNSPNDVAVASDGVIWLLVDLPIAWPDQWRALGLQLPAAAQSRPGRHRRRWEFPSSNPHMGRLGFRRKLYHVRGRYPCVKYSPSTMTS
jgi:hypothetical protein